MSGIVKPRCVCTMQEMGEDRWVKPDDGYFDPDPNCKKCKGKGYKEAKLVFGEGAEETYTWLCPVCGRCNGVHFQYPGISESPSEDHKVYCVNKDCANYRVNPLPLVNEKELN